MDNDDDIERDIDHLQETVKELSGLASYTLELVQFLRKPAEYQAEALNQIGNIYLLAKRNKKVLQITSERMDIVQRHAKFYRVSQQYSEVLYDEYCKR